MSATIPQTAEQPVLSLIAQIKDKKLQPQLLAVEDRRRCVEFLRVEGYGLAEIGQILACSERTIRRDDEHLRAQHALSPDPRLAERMIGQLVNEAEISMARLRRIARETGASAMERQMAERSAWLTCRELFQSLQSVGYLPRVPTNVVAEIFRHEGVEPIAGFDDLAQQMEEIMKVAQETGQMDERQSQRCRSLLDDVERGRLSARIEKFKTELTLPPPEAPQQ
jgi:hypothetical protein